jgi:alpha-N-arabinofuranosidase
VNGLVVGNGEQDIKVELVEKDGNYYLNTNIYEYIKDFNVRMINTEILGKAFEPEQYFENPDGTPIRFDSDYFGNHRGINVIPGPFASPSDNIKL